MAQKDSLQNKYNIAVAKAQDLQEQLRIKGEQWDERGREFEHTEKLVRDLCGEILKRDKDRQKLDKDSSEERRDIDKLVGDAQESLFKILKEKQDFLRKISRESESRREQIENLEEQVNATLESGIVNLTKEQLEAKVAKDREAKEAAEKSGAVLREGYRNGGATYVMKEEMDSVPEDEINNTTVQINHHITPVKTKKGGRQDRSPKEMTHVVSLTEWEKKLKNEDWALLLTIGSTGISEYPKIEKKILSENHNASKNKLRDSAFRLSQFDLLKREKVVSPASSFYMYRLLPSGARLYTEKTGEKPAISSLERLTKEHNNPNHGVGIQYTAEAIENNGEFKSVVWETGRKGLDAGNGLTYIPDITCTKENGRPLYIEFEEGTTGQNEFNAKCSKMASVTKSLYFVGPNQPVAAQLSGQVVKWIKNRHADTLADITVYVCSANRLANGGKVLNEETWDYVFKPGERGEEPIKY